MPPYVYNGPIPCDVEIDASNLAGKTAIVTGGANGLGEAYVRALIKAGAYVCIGDLDVEGGENLANEFSDKAIFVKCDTTNWDDQVNLFSSAVSFSSTGKIHYVVANAGIIRGDDVFSYTESDTDLTKPNLKTVEVNIHGTLYTTKLANHYFVKQNGQVSDPSTLEDTCLVLIASGAGFLDCLRIPQYSASKWAMRGIMHSLRRTAYHYGSRVNVIAPWYVKTKILTDQQFEEVRNLGVEFATLEDAGDCLLRILSDKNVNGHTLFLSARKWAPKSGYMDLDFDDYRGDKLIEDIQYDQMLGGPAEKGLFV